MGTGTRTAYGDPLKNFNYRVEVPGMKNAMFSYCSGLRSTTDIIEYRAGGQNETAKKSAGLTSYGNITLRQGLIVNPSSGNSHFDMYIWRIQVASVASHGYADFDYRRTMTVALQARSGEDAVRYDVYESWPSEMQAFGDLDGLGKDNVLQEVVIVNEGFDWEGGPQPAPAGQTLSVQLGI